MDATLVALAVIALLVILLVVRSVRVVPQHAVDVVERLGRYHRTLSSGMNIVLPGLDQTRARIDLREQVLALQKSSFRTADNVEPAVTVQIHFQVTDPLKATYEIANHVVGLEQLTMTVLRNVIGGMDLEAAMISYGQITTALNDVLGESAGNWGIQVNRVTVESVERPGG